jgi:hypothetical protein
VKGLEDVSAQHLEQYEFRAAELKKDEQYKDIEVMPADVKAIQNTAKGVSDMWSRALKANKSVERKISDRDTPILGYLQDIQLELHENDFGFTLTFEFEEN